MISSSHSLAWCPTQTIKSLNAANIIAGRATSGQIDKMQSQTRIHSPIHQYRYKSTYFAVNSMPCQTEVLAEIISGNKCQTLQTDFHISGGATLLNALHTYLICDSSFEMTSLTIMIKWLFRDWWLKPRRMANHPWGWHLLRYLGDRHWPGQECLGYCHVIPGTPNGLIV